MCALFSACARVSIWFALFLGAWPAHAGAARCAVTVLAEDYLELFGREAGPGKPSFLIQKVDLNQDGKPELFLAERTRCGARGCEYAVYERTADGCHRRILDFAGSFQVLPEGPHGFAAIRVKQKLLGEAGSASVAYVFDPAQGRYVEGSPFP